MGVGEALVSMLQAKGVPGMVERTMICPPASRIGPVTPEERRETMAASPVSGRYDQVVDRESAYEVLVRKAAEKTAQAQAAAAQLAAAKEQEQAERAASRAGGGRQTIVEALAKSVVRSVGSQIGRQVTRSLVRGLLGSLLR